MVHMEYPKKVMKMSELRRLGFPEQFLLDAYNAKNQTFAWKMNATAKNSPIIFDTDGLEKYRLALIKTEEQIKHRFVVA